ncbi:MAG: MMPL family transporter [Eubacteriales bacterium]|nr:MMPL family transporter [Eubacteriales bacterium]
MRKLADGIVKYRWAVFLVMMVVTVGAACLIPRVRVETDMSSYLPDSSAMKQGMELMETEFPEQATDSTVRVMFTDVPDEEKRALQEELADISGVSSVDYEEASEDYNKDSHTLYVLHIPYGYHSEEMEQIEQTLEESFAGRYGMVYALDDANGASLPLWIVVLAVTILMVILLAMCASWTEPFLFLFTIAAAILINMGTNAFLPRVSNTTWSIAAILQLVLSMDYSIILMNRYRQEREAESDRARAMAQAVRGAFGSILSSAVTTVVGLLALVFMSFQIGADLGIVLAKGVAISMLCIFTMLPALILAADPLIRRTGKKILPVPVGALAKGSWKLRKPVVVLFVLLFAGLYLCKGNTSIVYTMREDNAIDPVFPKTSTMVLLYENEDEQAAGELLERLEQDDRVIRAQGYGNTIGKQYTAQEMAAALEEMMTEGESGTGSKALSESGAEPEAGDTEEAALDSASLLNGEMLRYVYYLYYHQDDAGEAQTMTLAQLLEFLQTEAMQSSLLPAQATQALQTQLGQLGMLMQTPQGAAMLQNPEAYTAQEMTALFGQIAPGAGPDEETMELLYQIYGSLHEYDEEWTLSLAQLIPYLADDLTKEAAYASFFGKETLEMLADAKEQIEDGERQLVGEAYSLLSIQVRLDDESEETSAFLEELIRETDDTFTGEHYLIGAASMAYEMGQTFTSEMNRITAITFVSIFVVVMLTFRSLVIPAILGLLIQAAVYATMVIMGLRGISMNYLALLIVQSILMGATIDYAILYTTYYREKRRVMESGEAMKAAYEGSVHTILTSGLIMILVTWVLGYAFSDPSIGQICHTIALGATCSVVLILFILPGLLAAFDRWVRGKDSRVS